jgi:hypothetical protein
MSDGIENELNRSLELFVEAVKRTSNLEIVCTEVVDDADVLVIENSNVSEDVEGHQCTVDVSEIFATVTDCKGAQGFIDVINGDRNPIMCHGVTRIVGYYSRVSNWNKSKIGELRDRAKGQYGTGKHQPKHKEETLATINSH